MDPNGYESYVSSSTVLGEGVYQFLRGVVYGSIWSMVTPFPAPGSPAALAEAASGVFRPAPPFSSISTLPSSAIAFGTFLAVQRISCKSLELVRRRDDIWNHGFGFFVAYRYYSYFLGSSEKRLIRHNKIVGAGVVAAVFYANFIV